MQTAMGLNEYCLERLANGKGLEELFYMIGNSGREVTPVPWSRLPSEREKLLCSFFDLLEERNPDIVVHFTTQTFRTLATKVLDMDDLDKEGKIWLANPRILLMSVLGKCGAFIHMTALDTVAGACSAGDVFIGKASFLAIDGDAL
jgi:hypothetical protein